MPVARDKDETRNILPGDTIPVPAKPKSLVAKLAEVMAECHRIPKRGRNEFHKYDYATESDIVEVVREALASRSVMLIPSIVRQTREAVGDKGDYLTTLEMSFTFMDGETGETIERFWLGAGSDKSDKGLYKAMTGATKYYILKAFLLPTGDDPERDDPRDRKKAESKPKGKPEGYDDWLADMAATADEGEAALRKAWSSSNIDYRAYLTEVDESKWVGIKVRAKNADAGAVL